MPEDPKTLLQRSRQLRKQFNEGESNPEDQKALREIRDQLEAHRQRLNVLADAKKADYTELALLDMIRTETGRLGELKLGRTPSRPVPQKPVPKTSRFSIPKLPSSANERARNLLERLKTLYHSFDHFPEKPPGPKEDQAVTDWRGELNRLKVDISVTEIWLLFELGGGRDALGEDWLDKLAHDLERRLRKRHILVLQQDIRRMIAEQRERETIEVFNGIRQPKDQGLVESMGSSQEILRGLLRFYVFRLQHDAMESGKKAAAIRKEIFALVEDALEQATKRALQVIQKGRDSLDDPLVEHAVPTKDLKRRVKVGLGRLLQDILEDKASTLEDAIGTQDGYLFPLPDRLAPLPPEGTLNEHSSVPKPSSVLFLGAIVFITIMFGQLLMNGFGGATGGSEKADNVTVAVADAFGADGLRVVPAKGIGIEFFQVESNRRVAATQSDGTLDGVSLHLNPGVYTVRLDIGNFVAALPESCTQGYQRNFEIKENERVRLTAVVYSSNVADSGQSIAPGSSECIGLQYR